MAKVKIPFVVSIMMVLLVLLAGCSKNEVEPSAVGFLHDSSLSLADIEQVIVQLDMEINPYSQNGNLYGCSGSFVIAGFEFDGLSVSTGEEDGTTRLYSSYSKSLKADDLGKVIPLVDKLEAAYGLPTDVNLSTGESSTGYFYTWELDKNTTMRLMNIVSDDGSSSVTLSLIWQGRL